MRKSWYLALAGAVLMSGMALAGTLGQVVSIGGAAADVALDEARGVLYIANFTANRIEVMSLATRTIQTSINVAAQPSSISLSPDGRWLLVAHYGNNTAPASPANGLTLINLSNGNSRQTFALAKPPLGLAFGIDNRALVVTTTDFLLFDPAIGTTQVLVSIAEQAAATLPQPVQSFPPDIVQASVAASADGTMIYGFGDSLMFRYNTLTRGLESNFFTAAPPLAPRTVSVAADGSFAAMGWTMVDRAGRFYAEFPDPSGILNRGGHGVDSVHGRVYSEVPSTKDDPPVLTVYSADNLTVLERLQLPEHLAGRAVLSTDGGFMYASSDSGVLILPVGHLDQVPRLLASTEDLLFEGNFCEREAESKTFVLADEGGARVPFSITSTNAGVRVSPSSGVTPAVITVTVDPQSFAGVNGTVPVDLTIESPVAVNLPEAVRVLVNSREPDQRGTLINVPGKLVDLVANPGKDEYYVLRQDKNEVLVFNGANNTLRTRLRTCTTPMSMAVTFDRQRLLVGCDHSHVVSVFNLDTLEAETPVSAPRSYVQSIAASSKAILAVVRDGGGGDPRIERIELGSRRSVELPRLGVFENKVPLNSVLAPAPNGASILVASNDGSVMLYDANVDSFTVSRKDFDALEGAYAASAFGQYVVGNALLNSSLVPEAVLQGNGTSSGFAFLDQDGLFLTSAGDNGSGVLQHIDTSTGVSIRPTRTVESPLVGEDAAAFTRTLAPLFSRNTIVTLTTSGVAVLSADYDASVAVPNIARVASAADGVSPAAPGGLFTIYGSNLSPTNLATSEIPLPTALGNSCLTVNGQPVPMVFVSPEQINAQMPFQTVGNVTMTVHTPGGVSDNFNLTVLANAPAVFSADPGGGEAFPTVVRAENNLMVTDTNPVHIDDTLVIYLTGLGRVSPSVENGMPGPFSPLATTITDPVVTLGGVSLPVHYSGLVPGQVGLYQINVGVAGSIPLGLSVPLSISQGDFTYTGNVRVVD